MPMIPVQSKALFDCNPKLKLTQLVMRTGADTYSGAAEMEDNGQLVLKVSDGTHRILRGDALKPAAP